MHTSGALYLAKHRSATSRLVLTDCQMARLAAGESIHTIIDERERPGLAGGVAALRAGCSTGRNWHPNGYRPDPKQEQRFFAEQQKKSREYST